MSPIKGLSEVRRMPRIGKLHTGTKKMSEKSGKEYPVQVDYFVFPEGYAEALKKAFGTDQPKSLPIRIPSEDEERWANQYYRHYSRTRGLVCKGDGDIATRLIDLSTGEWFLSTESKNVGMRDVRCKGRECPDYCESKCKEVMMMQFIVDADIPGMGIWQLDTSSINAILNINSAAEFIRFVYGKVSMIPLTLSLEPTMVKRPDGKQTEMPILYLRPREDASISMGKLLERAKTLALKSGDLPIEADDEIPEVDESYPEMVARDAQAPSGQAPAPEIAGQETAEKQKVRKPRAKKPLETTAAQLPEPGKEQVPAAANPPATPAKKEEPTARAHEAQKAKAPPEEEAEDPDWTALKSATEDDLKDWQKFFDIAFRIQQAGGAKVGSVAGVCGALGIKQISDWKKTKEEALVELSKLNGVKDWRKL